MSINNLLEALHVLKEHCKGTDCDDCPMSDMMGDCQVNSDIPLNWELEKLVVEKIIF